MRKLERAADAHENSENNAVKREKDNTGSLGFHTVSGIFLKRERDDTRGPDLDNVTVAVLP